MSTNIVTVADIIAEAQRAAETFNGPIRIGAGQRSNNPQLLQLTSDLIEKRSEIISTAAQQTFNSTDLSATLAQLQANTQVMTATAMSMVDANMIIAEAAGFLAFGTKAVDIIKSADSGRTLKLANAKMCSNPSTPHLQSPPYSLHCPICGYAVYDVK